MIDLLAFGPHPDDIEIGLGGTVARHVALGFSVGLCDLTAGEMGSNGTVEERLAESAEACRVLGAAWRENLRWPDRRIGKDPAHLDQAVSFIRRSQPRVVALPYWSDRHPDHVAAAEILTEAVFSAGLRRYQTGEAAWRPERTCYYFINDSTTPSFVVDVSEQYDRKMRALDCHKSQFATPSGEEAPTRLNTPLFKQLIESRDAHFGALAGVRRAEGIVVRDLLLHESLMTRAT